VRPGVGFQILLEERVQSRLGGGRPGHLPTEAIDVTLQAAHRFLSRVRNGTEPRVIAVATAAVRDAANRDRLLASLERHAGVSVRVLTAREEARLGAQAALRSMPIRQGAIADLGGSSLQISRVREGRPIGFASLPLGAVRLTRRALPTEPATPRQLRALRCEIRDQLLGVLPPAGRDDQLVGLGGTVRTLARIHLAHHPGRRSRHGLRMRQSDVTAIRERVEALSLRDRRRMPGLKAERADIILAGAIAIEELMVFGGYLVLTVCTVGVRDGLLFQETFNGGPAS
jgi:exopolyphosphatase/guanosine-5'-triphosphate,3'-diphosphate pyrophosphatase